MWFFRIYLLAKVIRGRAESVFIQFQSGGSAGGGAEKTPAGDYSVNFPNIEHLLFENHLMRLVLSFV
jgi:hypothetical protein